MRLRSLILAGAFGVGLILAGPGTASANIAWCVSDPPVQVVTPDGHNLLVNNYLYVPPRYAHLAKQVTAVADANRDGVGGTLITVYVHVPRGMENLYVVSAEQRYRVTAHGTGPSGTYITLSLDVPVS